MFNRTCSCSMFRLYLYSSSNGKSNIYSQSINSLIFLKQRSAVSTYLAGLSISDSCLLSLGLIFSINSSIPPNQQSESFYSSHLHKHLFPYVYACIIWFQFTSVWITIGFAVDRWFAIKWPMLHYTYSSKRAWLVICFFFLLSTTNYCVITSKLIFFD